MENGRHTLIGVAAYKSRACEKGAPSKFARVTTAMKWIKEIIKESSCSSCSCGIENGPQVRNAPNINDIIALTDKDMKGKDQQFDTRLFGGKETTANKYPWMTVVMKKSWSWPLCRGSIISHNHILSGISILGIITYYNLHNVENCAVCADMSAVTAGHFVSFIPHVDAYQLSSSKKKNTALELIFMAT